MSEDNDKPFFPKYNPYGLPEMTPEQAAAFMRKSFDNEMHRVPFTS